MRYATGQWNCEKLGNHRVVLRVDRPATDVWAHIEWRRHDPVVGAETGEKELILILARTGERIRNVARINVTRETCDLVFEAPEAGEYFVYTFPYIHVGESKFMAKFFPHTKYLRPKDTSDPDWLIRHSLTDEAALRELPAATVIEMQAINDFHRFDPMEIIATEDEVHALLARYPDERFLVFPEDRRNAIRMLRDIPRKWIETGPADTFRGEACRGEYYAFQLGVYAVKCTDHVGLRFSDAKRNSGGSIPADAFDCINLGGRDWLGRDMTKDVSVSPGRIQALWCGVAVPPEAAPGLYESTVTILADNMAGKSVKIRLTVTDKLRTDSGDDEPWRHSRLRWLNSTMGLDDETVEPYTPVAIEGGIVKVLGRQFEFNESGLPARIRSTFPMTVDRTDAEPVDILASPMRFIVDAGGPLEWHAGGTAVTSRRSGAITWESESCAKGFTLKTRAKMECDGYVNYRLTVSSADAADVNDMALEIPFSRQIATYMMGLGHRGGYRPAELRWEWRVGRTNNQFWIGEVNAGLNCKLKHLSDDWSMSTLARTGLYRDWSNDGKGGCALSETGENTVTVRAFTGPKHMEAGEELHFNFALLVTPVKVLDKDHWQWRYVHGGEDAPRPVPEYVATGARIVNVHHATPINPHINYPFITTDEMKAYVDEAHRSGLKFKTYYTARELTNYTTELWALRSLNGEVFTDGPGVTDPETRKTLGRYRRHSGDSWLCEHLVDGYVAQWHAPLGMGVRDAAIETVGLSRWHNYYIEGLRWLVENIGIDGLYLDGIGYDREIMKRVRKVMQRTRAGCLIDFHSGNEFKDDFGGTSPACSYVEHFPFIDSIWFGEGFDYENTSPDYWLVEMSGIPFGLFGEMLQNGGNVWRGMLYGMTGRLGWADSNDPRPVWRMWDEFGIGEADMIGYWVPDCPVRTDNPDVLATVYRRKDKALVSIASWAEETVECTLAIEWNALGMDGRKAHITAPAIDGFQAAAAFGVDEAIPVRPARGLLLLIVPLGDGGKPSPSGEEKLTEVSEGRRGRSGTSPG
jgi:hypothetical protein